ncbi:MAG TPA: peptide ABC transporter substrate-binding protein [Gemmatimonadaceae bacterium]|nr:peptide ABC transporter substrate-binding protein [Gemmatimonadaceae bacterium]
MTRAARWSILRACLVAGVAAACGAPARDRSTVVYASGADLESGNPLVTVHPLSRQVQRYLLFVTLARYDSALAPSPYAASRWEWSADRRALTFHLVAGLAWQDGAPTSASDVSFTIDAARDPVTGYPRAAELSVVDSTTTPDDSTVVLHFGRPQFTFPLVLCELPILPRHLLATVDRREMRRAAFNLAPVGNGPFRFTERRAGDHWSFARNERFPVALGGPPKLDGVVIVVVDEATTKFAGLASGDLDVAGIAPSMASLVRRDPSLRVIDYPVLFTVGLVFNTHRPPFDDPRVRHAIDLAIDRKRILSAALAGYGTPASGPVPPDNPLALEAEPEHDPHRADSLLDAAGWHRGSNGIRARDGKPFAVQLLTVGSGDNALEQLVQADLAERGIRLGIRQVELGRFLTEARAPRKEFDLLVAGIPGDLSLSYVGAMFDSRQAGGALDYAGFHTRQLDSLFTRTREAPSANATRDAWVALQQQLARDLPVAWIYHSRGVQGISARLLGVRMDLRGELATVASWRVAGARDSSRTVTAAR